MELSPETIEMIKADPAFKALQKEHARLVGAGGSIDWAALIKALLPILIQILGGLGGK